MGSQFQLGLNRAAAAAAMLAPQLLAAPRIARRLQANLGGGNLSFRGGNGPRGLQMRRGPARGPARGPIRGGPGNKGANVKGGANLKRGANVKGQKGQKGQVVKGGRKVKGRRNQGDRYQINKPWVTDEIKAAHEKKVELANKLKGNKNDELFAEFKTKRDEFVKLYDAARQEYNKNKVNDIRWTDKIFYNIFVPGI